MQGSLDLREFTAAVRKQGHISSKTASEREVQVLFDMVDLDKSGQLSLSEWYLFLGLTKDGEPKDASPKPSPKSSPRSAGKPSPQASPRSSDGEGGASEEGDASSEAGDMTRGERTGTGDAGWLMVQPGGPLSST